MLAAAPDARQLNNELVPATVLPRLAADLGARLVTEPVEMIDEVIADGLGRIIGALGADCALLWPEAAAVPLVVRAAAFNGLQSVHPELPQLPAMRFVSGSLAAGEGVFFRKLEHVRDSFDRERLRRHGLRSAAIVPIVIGKDRPGDRGALVFASTVGEREWADVIDHLHVVSTVIAQGLSRKYATTQSDDNRRERHARRRAVADALVTPDRRAARSTPLIVSQSPAVQRALAQLENVAQTPATVLLLGETGVGKEVFAQAIHDASGRRHRPMVRVSCAAIPNTLIESELFGRERGAYTGAVSRQIGRFEAAHQSTIFLDEIGELSLDVQVKLLRVIQERAIERLGSNAPVKVDVRIIAATNRNLERAVEEKTFRDDLFYRLNVFPIVVPPLRDRAEDIPGLVWKFVDEISALLGKTISEISPLSMRQLQQYSWPGNVRELRNVVERAVIMAAGPMLHVQAPRVDVPPPAPTVQTLRGLEADHIRATLVATNWRVRGAEGAAERLGMKPTTLETRMAKLGILRPRAGTKN